MVDRNHRGKKVLRAGVQDWLSEEEDVARKQSIISFLHQMLRSRGC